MSWKRKYGSSWKPQKKYKKSYGSKSVKCRSCGRNGHYSSTCYYRGR